MVDDRAVQSLSRLVGCQSINRWIDLSVDRQYKLGQSLSQLHAWVHGLPFFGEINIEIEMEFETKAIVLSGRFGMLLQ